MKNLLMKSLVLLGTLGLSGLAQAHHHHKLMQKAEHHLQEAITELERADHHFDGHRAKALEFAKQAKEEAKLAVEWATAHKDEMKHDKK